MTARHAIVKAAKTLANLTSCSHKLCTYVLCKCEDFCSPPVVCVEVGSGKTDQRFVEENAYNNHQSSDSVGPPEDRG